MVGIDAHGCPGTLAVCLDRRFSGYRILSAMSRVDQMMDCRFACGHVLVELPNVLSCRR